ncbi:MAG: hypothetical protein EHM40_13195 [Chloroflexi bacterium]|nr:MAG: hypothetical protein EHM40_13195 [Chloroflexota bacterium]
MAKVHNNVLVRGLKGLLGDQLVLKTDKAGRTIVSNKPVFASDRVFTPAQRTQQERFRLARAYARSAKDLEIYKAKAEGTPRTPSNIAMMDWFHPPEVREIDLSEWTGQARQPIRIRAVDDVQVKQVSVVIMNEHDAVLEQGPATVEDDGWWTYQTRTTVAGKSKVLVAAEDLPGHVTQTVKSLN